MSKQREEIEMWYVPLNTQIDSGTSRRPDSITITISRETDKAVGFESKSSRTGVGALIWVPKSTILAIGPKAVCFDARWPAEKFNRTVICEDSVQGQFAGKDELDAAILNNARRIANGERLSKREIMKRAWHIAKFAATSFGGSSREYFAEALKMAWAGD